MVVLHHLTGSPSAYCLSSVNTICFYFSLCHLFRSEFLFEEIMRHLIFLASLGQEKQELFLSLSEVLKEFFHTEVPSQRLYVCLAIPSGPQSLRCFMTVWHREYLCSWIALPCINMSPVTWTIHFLWAWKFPPVLVCLRN